MRKAQRIQELEKENEQLKSEVTRLTDKLEIFEKVKEVEDSVFALTGTIGASISDGQINFPDDVLVYVDDYYGGKVIKQEATDLTVLDASGKATYHKTKQAPDKGYKYRLERTPAPTN